MSAPEAATTERLSPDTCRECGRLILVRYADPAPGLCSRCYDRMMLFDAFEWSDTLAHDRPTEGELAGHFRHLVRLGLRPAAAARGVRRLAEWIKVPCPAEVLGAIDLAWERAWERATEEPYPWAERPS